MVIAQKEVLITFWKRTGFEGGERETDLLVHAHWTISLFSSISSLFFSVFFLIFFSFLLLCFSFFTPWILYFLVPFSGHGKGLFIVPAVTNVLPLCPLTAFVWSGHTCRPPSLCDIHPCQTKASLFHSSVHRSIFTCHGINAFPLFPSRHAPNGSPLNLDYFGWSVIPTGRTSQKGLGRNRKIDLFSFPHHQTIPPLPLTSGPWPHHVLYWLGTGWWCLGLARAFLSDMSKSLPATHASALIWRLSVCVFWPFMWAFLWFPAPFKSWVLSDDGPYISLVHSLIFFISYNVELLFLL